MFIETFEPGCTNVLRQRGSVSPSDARRGVRLPQTAAGKRYSLGRPTVYHPNSGVSRRVTLSFGGFSPPPSTHPVFAWVASHPVSSSVGAYRLPAAVFVKSAK